MMKRFIEIMLLLLGATKGYPPTDQLTDFCEKAENAKDEEEEEKELWEFIRKWGN